MTSGPDDPTVLRRGDALLIVDVQRDFCPGGALPIAGGDTIVPVVNGWITRARQAGVPVFASRDLHPADHMSFHAQGGPWPSHCVQETAGATFHPALQLPETATVVTKGDRADREQYSAFDGTDLGQRLRAAEVRRVFVAGLAQDVCVRATVLDARKEGFDVHLLAGATQPISPESGQRALDEMTAAGVIVEQ